MKLLFTIFLFNLFIVSCASSGKVSGSDVQLSNDKDSTKKENNKVEKTINGKKVVIEEKKVKSVSNKTKSVNK